PAFAAQVRGEKAAAQPFQDVAPLEIPAWLLSGPGFYDDEPAAAAPSQAKKVTQPPAAPRLPPAKQATSARVPRLPPRPVPARPAPVRQTARAPAPPAPVPVSRQPQPKPAQPATTTGDPYAAIGVVYFEHTAGPRPAPAPQPARQPATSPPEPLRQALAGAGGRAVRSLPAPPLPSAQL